MYLNLLRTLVYIQSGCVYLNLHVHFAILTELLYSLQWDGETPLHLAVKAGHTSCVERLLSTPGIDVNMKDSVGWSVEYFAYMSIL